MDTPIVIVLVVAILALIGVAAWLYMQKRRSDGLRTSFARSMTGLDGSIPISAAPSGRSRSGKSASSSFTFGPVVR